MAVLGRAPRPTTLVRELALCGTSGCRNPGWVWGHISDQYGLEPPLRCGSKAHRTQMGRTHPQIEIVTRLPRANRLAGRTESVVRIPNRIGPSAPRPGHRTGHETTDRESEPYRRRQSVPSPDERTARKAAPRMSRLDRGRPNLLTNQRENGRGTIGSRGELQLRKRKPTSSRRQSSHRRALPSL